MALFVVQLSDLHAYAKDNFVLDKWDALCRAVVSDLHDVETCVIVFSGDAAWGGKAAEFKESLFLIETLQQFIKEKYPGIAVTTVSVPGNHDCDLTTEDQDARTTLRNKVFAERAAPSVQRILLEPQKNYFQFSRELAGSAEGAITSASPFYNSIDIKSGGRIVRFHLVNSAWTSIIHETEDLRYPLCEFMPPTTPTADFAITVIHHPYHWFIQPEVRRDQIEANSDLVLTGHEHMNELAFRAVDQGPNLSYLEGGVLQEKDRPNLCMFNVIRLDFEADSRLVKRYAWNGSHFGVEGTPQAEMLLVNSLRRDRKLRLTREFEKRLDELEDLVNHPRTADVRLSQIFSYPDLRKHEDKSQEPADDTKDATPVTVWIRSDRVFNEIF